MENNQERVLAYKLAKEISNRELIDVSGGGANISCEGTFTGSASSDQGTYGQADVHWDF